MKKLALLAFTLIIISGCSLKCPVPTIIDYDNNICCEDLNQNRNCDNTEEKPLKYPGVDLPEPRSNSSDVNDTKGDNMTESKQTIVGFSTNKGVIKVKLEDERAPITTKNFISLVNSGFYNRLSFHRYVPGFVIQGGDPKGDGTGGSDTTIRLEVSPGLIHEEGVIAMARSNDPDSASSQFYFTLAPTHQLDGQYAVFGKVTEGIDVVKELREGDKMETVRVEN